MRLPPRRAEGSWKRTGSRNGVSKHLPSKPPSINDTSSFRVGRLGDLSLRDLSGGGASDLVDDLLEYRLVGSGGEEDMVDAAHYVFTLTCRS
jgi:hypothetical protein